MQLGEKRGLLQFRVLRFGMLLDEDVTVGVSPQSGFELCPSTEQKARMPPEAIQ